MGNIILMCTGDIRQFRLKERKVSSRKRLGEGAFSYVDLVVDTSSGEEFAMKRIIVHDQKEQDHAKKEIDCYKLFKHPNIVRVVDEAILPSRAHPGANEVVCLFPVYKRGTLQDKIDELKASGNQFSEAEMMNLFRGICKGLREMHHYKTPLCHRDIKPGNVLLSDQNEPVLTDFGSVEKGNIKIKNQKQAMAEQDKAAEFSTLPYRAPELVEVTTTRDLSCKIDIWSLGVLLYAMAYHETPFEKMSANGGSVALAICQGKVDFPESDQYTQTFRDFVKKLLTLDPEKRPDISAVMADLDKMYPA